MLRARIKGKDINKTISDILQAGRVLKESKLRIAIYFIIF